MADLVVISSSIVRPKSTNQSNGVKIHLTPWDLFLLHFDYVQRGLLFPKPEPESESDFISPLKASLSLALEVFYPFAGRVVKVENEDNTVSFFIDCDGSGAKFVHAVAKTVSTSDLLQSTRFVPACFFPANGIKSYEGVSEPLLAVQVTEIRDGVFIGFGYNHLVADGSSFWKFFKTWSVISSRGLGFDSPPLPLRLKGWFLDGIDHPIRIPVSETETSTCDDVSTQPILQEKVFHFTEKNISELKAKANDEIGSEDQKISSLQAIVGHMWRSIIKYSGLSHEEHTHCKFAIDMRHRLNPPLETECFGNVINIGIVTITVGELLENRLGWAGLQINKMVGSQTGENFINFTEEWVKNVKIPKGVGSRSSSDSLLVASSPRFDVYGNDFGWGKPVAIRAGPGNISNGKLVMYRGIEEGSIDVHAYLRSDVLINMLNDVAFMQYVVVE